MTSTMWVYFSSWESEHVREPDCIIVPVTMPLDEEEEMKLVDYFNTDGQKVIPPGLPYLDGGKMWGIKAKAAKELGKLAAAAADK